MGTPGKHGPAGLVMQRVHAALVVALLVASLFAAMSARALSTDDGWLAYDAGDFSRAFER